MKIHITNLATRSLCTSIEGKKPRGWKQGDPIPQLQYCADFDEHGNSEVEDVAGKALVAEFSHIKVGHKKIETSAPASSKEE